MAIFIKVATAEEWGMEKACTFSWRMVLDMKVCTALNILQYQIYTYLVTLETIWNRGSSVVYLFKVPLGLRLQYIFKAFVKK